MYVFQDSVQIFHVREKVGGRPKVKGKSKKEEIMIHIDERIESLKEKEETYYCCGQSFRNVFAHFPSLRNNYEMQSLN